MIRAQCIVNRQHEILMVKHRLDGIEWWCLPGGGVEHDETAPCAAVRELQEECGVAGKIIRQTSHYVDDSGIETITFLVDIASQVPRLGVDPELSHGSQVLVDMQWLPLDELPERDRAYLWAAGLLSVPPFMDEVSAWGDELSYPLHQTKV